MTSYAITGASGQLGRRVVQELLARGVNAADIIAIVRSPAKVPDLARQGLQVRTGEYSSPSTLLPALTGADRLLLISSNEPGRRVQQHEAVINAAKEAKLSRIAYTGALNSSTSQNALLADHVETEEILRNSGIDYTFLRNGMYSENYASQVPQYLRTGYILGAARSGKIASASRSDYAAGAAAALVSNDDGNLIYELAGSKEWSMDELAAEVSAVTGVPVRYRDLSKEDYVQTLEQAGIPAALALFVATGSASVADGDGTTSSGDLEKLIGRSTTPLSDTIREVFSA